ncbi:hypothetical protein GOP47_0013638 [Adiantum capillus-veneris]|uniref:Aldehyde dehydrogenase domain-containing protein n=1 Tax=Adiantum capillus-veneris TaxID=13818 RepID=A0A9D4UPE4_ADICA|nr:hypothetical protein GOP47_0013638 [Adiantum capillus-veneris]
MAPHSKDGHDMHAAAATNIQPAGFPIKYTKLFIDGEFVDAISGKTFQSLNPSTGELLATVAEADVADVNKAVKAARKAFEEGPWPRLSGYERGRILHKFADLLEQNEDELAHLETLDNGKPLFNSRYMDVVSGVKYVRMVAGWADKVTGQTFKLDGPYQGISVYEPYGVIGAIIPWNFPILMFIVKVASSLAAGNSIVIKPAEQTPLTALYMAALAKQAGVSDGALNVVPGFGPIAGASIASHMDIDKVGFMGSTHVGRLIMEAAAKSNLKPVSLELGGKSPLVICEDADLDTAVEIANGSLFFNMGQCCTAGSRTFVQESIYEAFVNKAIEKAKKIVIGDPFKVGVEHGPQVDEKQFKKTLDYIESGKAEGARLLTGGHSVGKQGYFIEPTIFTDVKDDMKIATDEIFGPVMSILKFKTLDELIKRANDSKYGLAASILTKDIDVAHKFARSLRVGTVWINCYHVYDQSVPFGGYKMSGFGREHGLASLLSHMQLKSIIYPLKDSPWL